MNTYLSLWKGVVQAPPSTPRDLMNAIRCGPLFDTEAPAEGLQHIGDTVSQVAEDVIERAKGRAA